MYFNDLKVCWLDKFEELFCIGVGNFYFVVQFVVWIFVGYFEGYLEVFVNIYWNFVYCLCVRFFGQKLDLVYEDFLIVEDGVCGMRFIDWVIEFFVSDQKWLLV